MKNTLIAAALCATTIACAGPALAQPYGPPPGAAPIGRDFREQMDELSRRIDSGIRAGQIDRGEADRATREMASIRAEHDMLRARNGGQLSDVDRGRLQERLDSLSRSIHWMRENGPGGPPPYAVRPAPPPVPAGGDWSLERREGWLQDQINRGRADNSLDRSEAFRVQRALNDIRATQATLLRRHHGNLYKGDRAMLQDRLDHLSDSVRWLKSNGEFAAPWRR